ncbi:MAG TPA: ferredoxin reductase family protein [Streptosporangiaceae bacterium]|nr:ferredoxin reductase family protein [Streptosporangiaceae bacterium]
MSAPTVSFESTRPADRRGKRRLVPARQPAPQPRPVLAKAALVLAGAGLGAVTAVTITTETASQLHAAGGLATFVGSLTGMVGTYLALLMVLLVSRIPAIERVLGQDGLLRWHRWLAPWPISLLTAHAVFITVGYAQAARAGLWHQAGVLLGSYPDVLIATIGLAIMCLIGVISIRAIRSRLRREAWWLVHLYMYLALALAFAHVIVLGPAFVGHPLTRLVWSVAWAGTAGLVICYRFGLPVVRSLRHRLVVAEVRPEGPGVVSVICSGRNLDKLAVAGGQFLSWRFLTRGSWWQAHPYSLSALPQPPYLRLTVKAVGDHSASLAHLRPGTKVMVEGPYGAFTRHAQVRPKALLVAAGIGVTALRSLLEDLPRNSAPVVLLRASRPEDLVLGKEVTELVRHRRGQLHELVGSREQAAVDEWSLPRLVPDLHRRDVFVCGPEGFVASIVDVARNLGVPDEAIHHEAFAL